MGRRVMRRVAPEGKETVDYIKIEDETLISDENGGLDWTGLPDDTVIQIFSCLNYRDRASLSSTCKTWRAVGRAPCLWQDLDLRFHKFNLKYASSLASRCEKLEKIRFWGHESAEAVINLQAKNLKHIAGDYCRGMTDATLCVLASRHPSLQSLQIGPCGEKITSDAIKAVAICCPNLQKLRLSAVSKLEAHAINALAEHCICLVEIGFTDCDSVDESALGNVKSLRFLSVEGGDGVNWATAAQHWAKLPHLVGLDVSRTDVNSAQLFDLYSSLPSLKVLCAFYCQGVETESTFLSAFNHKRKVLLSDVNNILKVLATLFVDTPEEDDFNVFLHWRDLKVKDKKLDGMLNWLERVISRFLLDISEYNPPDWDDFWLDQGTRLLLSFLQSSDEVVQEEAAALLAASVVVDPDAESIDKERAQAAMRQGGIRLLLNLASSWREGLHSVAVQAIETLSEDGQFAEAVANEGGIAILTNLARFAKPSVAQTAAWGLSHLSFLDAHKGAIAESGGVKALVDLISTRSGSSPGWVLECCAKALANLASSDECRKEIASVCGINALTMLAKTSKSENVQKQAARALATLAAHVYNPPSH